MYEVRSVGSDSGLQSGRLHTLCFPQLKEDMNERIFFFFLKESGSIGGTEEVTFYKKKFGAGCRGGCFQQKACNVVPEYKSASFERETCEIIPARKPK